MDNFEVTPEILEQFKTESRENISHAEAALLALDKSVGASEAINELFRAIHTIKGSADYLGLTDLKELSHSFENVLDRLRKLNSTVLSTEQSDLFFNVLDVVGYLVESAPLAIADLTSDCKRLVERMGGLQTLDAPVSPESDGNKSTKIFRDTVEQQCEIISRAKTKVQSSQSIDPGVRGMVSRALQCMSNASEFVGEGALETLSDELKSWVLSPSLSKDAREFVIRIESYLPFVGEVLEKQHKCGDKTSHLKPTEAKTGSEHEFERAPDLSHPTGKVVESKTVRVDQAALDGFMNLVGELIVARNSFTNFQSRLMGSEDERIVALKEFRESSNRLIHITGELQRNVMKMRMVPVNTLFQRYPRIVRDVCRKIGKTVEVVFDGGDTEIDKGIADQISEPLVHLVRNAVDHGIESAEVRKKAGKSESGTLILRAFHQGNFMVIEVTDDGGGIDVEKIRSKIIDRGLLTAVQASKCSDSEILNYIFTPGFSTAAAITDISGRGVGLDVVNTNLKKVKGNVSVSTDLNQGTCFRLEVPLTVAIMRALLVKSRQSIYAISLKDVKETVKINSDELKWVGKKSAISLRGEIVMVEWLSHLLGHSIPQKLNRDTRLPILILEVNGEKIGLIVDSVFRQEEIVVKPLPESYSGVQGLAGASILGDGKTILILDSNQLYSLMTGSCAPSGQLSNERICFVA